MLLQNDNPTIQPTAAPGRMPVLPRSGTPSSSRTWYICLILAAAFLSIGIAPGRVATPDAHLRIAQAFNVIEHRTFAVPDGIGNPMHGNLVTAPDGRRFSVYNVGQIGLFVPLAWVATYLPSVAGLHAHYRAEFLASFLGPMVHFSTAILMVAIFELLGVERRRAALIGVIYAFATFGLPHAMDGYEHPYEAIGIAAAVYFILKAQRSQQVPDSPPTGLEPPRLLGFAFAGASLAAAALFRNSAWAALPGLLFLIQSWKARAWFIVATLPFIGLIFFYNSARFGSPFETGYMQAWHTANPQLNGRSGFSPLSLPSHLFGLWFSWGKGMVLYSPILLTLFALPFVTIPQSLRRVAVAMILICLPYNGLYAANFAWHGSEWCWGPRYLIPTLVPLVLLVGLCIPQSRLLRRSWIALLYLSISVQLVAISVSYQRPLLAMYRADPKSFAEKRVLYSADHSPLFRQFVAFYDVVGRTVHPARLEVFIGPGPWRNEARPASIEAMLGESIDLNAFNFWWVRTCYFPLSTTVRSLAFLIGLSSLLLGSCLIWRAYLLASPKVDG